MLDMKKENENMSSKYVKSVLEQNEDILPKSTTCCWVLSKNINKFDMKQYFVSTQYLFALDLSSRVLTCNEGTGATFMSSMFSHSTSIPIWKDEHGRIYLQGPKDMYNFAWGSNGTNKEK